MAIQKSLHGNPWGLRYAQDSIRCMQSVTKSPLALLVNLTIMINYSCKKYRQ